MARQGKPIKRTAKLLDWDMDARPNLRVRFHRPHRSQKEVMQSTSKWAKKVLALVQNNISTGGNYKWKPVQWGPKAGQRALQGTEEQWTFSLTNSTTAVVRPKRQFRRMWRGHTKWGGCTIVPKKKRALTLHYPGYILLATKVYLPRRDPRPTDGQLRRLQ